MLFGGTSLSLFPTFRFSSLFFFSPFATLLVEHLDATSRPFSFFSDLGTLDLSRTKRSFALAALKNVSSLKAFTYYDWKMYNMARSKATTSEEMTVFLATSLRLVISIAHGRALIKIRVFIWHPACRTPIGSRTFTRYGSAVFHVDVSHACLPMMYIRTMLTIKFMNREENSFSFTFLNLLTDSCIIRTEKRRRGKVFDPVLRLTG